MTVTSSRMLIAVVAVLSLPAPAGASPGEVIIVEGRRPRPRVPARATNHDRIATPPYSDRAIESDAWVRAWLLLDVDERGRVTRLKFINRPGYDLEGIAAQQAFGLRFTPARDASSRAIKSWVVWGIEWPSYWWLVTMLGTSTRMPPLVGMQHPRSMAASVPCRGSGPLNLDSVHPVYRDCSMPDLARPFDAEPWVNAPDAPRRSR